jgi:hypothetical protein
MKLKRDTQSKANYNKNGVTNTRPKSCMLVLMCWLIQASGALAGPLPLPNNLTEEQIEEAAEALVNAADNSTTCTNSGTATFKLITGCSKSPSVPPSLCNNMRAKYKVIQKCENCKSQALETTGSAKCIHVPQPNPSDPTCLQAPHIEYKRSEIDCAKFGNGQTGNGQAPK